MRYFLPAALVAVGLGFAGFVAAEKAAEKHLNAVVVSVTTEEAEGGGQVRVLTVSIPEKNDELKFTIPSSDKELFEAAGKLQKGDKLVVAVIFEDGKYRLREFAKAK
jgi:hypothetical protein